MPIYRCTTKVDFNEDQKDKDEWGCNIYNGDYKFMMLFKVKFSTKQVIMEDLTHEVFDTQAFDEPIKDGDQIAVHKDTAKKLFWFSRNDEVLGITHTEESGFILKLNKGKTAPFADEEDDCKFFAGGCIVVNDPLPLKDHPLSPEEMKALEVPKDKKE